MKRDPDCIFCKIVEGAIPSFKLFENDATLAFMDINPLNDGHCLVIAKPHHPDLFDLPPALLAEVALSLARVARAVRDELAPEGLNLLQANGRAAAQSVPHFHIHVVPRRMNDGASLNWTPRPGDMKAIGQLAERIRARIG
ncbi:MAG: HIT family protein [Alphaproteobacteria bacterium]|nr:HIT family protein [Alphaproteobacteria bacterium]